MCRQSSRGGHPGTSSRTQLAANRLSRLTPTISMMKSAQACVGNYDCIRRRLRFPRAPTRRVLLQGIVEAILVVIAHVITNRPGSVGPSGPDLPLLEPWNRANCFRRKRVSATNAARGRAARATNTTKSKATAEKAHVLELSPDGRTIFYVLLQDPGDFGASRLRVANPRGLSVKLNSTRSDLQQPRRVSTTTRPRTRGIRDLSDFSASPFVGVCPWFWRIIHSIAG